MKNSDLKKLVSLARRHQMSRQERQEQGISYILGNVAVDGPQIFYGTVTMAVPPALLGRSQKVSSIVTDESEPRIPFDVNGAVRQFRLVQRLVEEHVETSKQITIDAALICQLHAATGDPVDPNFGKFRSTEVQVGTHRAPPSLEVAKLVDKFCDDLTSDWEASTPIRLAAFALWRLNWIHPFVDANGRTARALCYLILNLKFGCLLPGAPTLLEQLSDRRSSYLDALASVDSAYAKTGSVDVEPLAQLLEELLLRQLRNLPAQSHHDEIGILNIFERRIAGADPDLLSQVYGDTTVNFRTWASGDVLIMHVAPQAEVERAETLFERYGRPFPGLIGGVEDDVVLTLETAQRGVIVQSHKFDVRGAALHLEPSVAAVVISPQINFVSVSGQENWKIGGALYLLRSGPEMGALGTLDVLDRLIRRHLQEG